MGCCSSNNFNINEYSKLKGNVDESESDESDGDIIDKLVVGYIRNSIQDSLGHDIETLILYFFGTYGVDGDLVVKPRRRSCLEYESKKHVFQFGSIHIEENAVLFAHDHSTVFITCFGDVIIEKGGKIDLSGSGYTGTITCNGGSYKSRPCDSVHRPCGCCCISDCYGGGGGLFCCEPPYHSPYAVCCKYFSGGGGGYGGYGTCNLCCLSCPCFCCCCCVGYGGCKYGDKQLSTLYMGSAGGSASTYCGNKGGGGNGGGAIRLQCFGTIILKEDARIECNGEDGECRRGANIGGGGGGSGGSIHIIIKDKKHLQMNMTSMISAKGGRGHRCFPFCCCIAGNGGDGRIRIQFMTRNKKKILRDKYNITPKPYIG